MITLIEALNFRCLRYIRQPLGPFHVLVGPNGSGKTTFLDVPSFLGHIASSGIEAAVKARGEVFHDLVWNRGTRLGLAVEAAIPSEFLTASEDSRRSRIRYEVMLGFDVESGKPAIDQERLWLLRNANGSRAVKTAGRTAEAGEPPSILIRRPYGARLILHKQNSRGDTFRPEVGGASFPPLRLGPRRSALENLPEDPTKFPAAAWFRRFLADDLQTVSLNSSVMKKPSLTGPARRLNPDGSNLPLLVERLRKESPARFRDWLRHLRTVLPDLTDLRAVRSPDNALCWLLFHYQNGPAIPSWAASDGTLRALALTILAYLKDFTGLCLIEEPENGIHPTNVETVCQSLSSLYEAQVLVATHSPVVVSAVELDQVLCFRKTAEGTTEIIPGPQHPLLRDWRGLPNLSVLYAGGVLD